MTEILAKAIVYGKMHVVRLPDGMGVGLTRVAATDEPFDMHGIGRTFSALIFNRDIIEFLPGEDAQDPDEDAAEHDSLFADWIDGEGIDYAEYHDQNFHARG